MFLQLFVQKWNGNIIYESFFLFQRNVWLFVLCFTVLIGAPSTDFTCHSWTEIQPTTSCLQHNDHIAISLRRLSQRRFLYRPLELYANDKREAYETSTTTKSLCSRPSSIALGYDVKRKIHRTEIAGANTKVKLFSSKCFWKWHFRIKTLKNNLNDALVSV